MMTFLPGRATASKDLLELQLRAGGQPGVVYVAGRSLPVLKLAPGVYATDEKVHPQVRAEAFAAGSDIHEVGTASDFHFFLQRFKRFDKEEHETEKS
jgi:hypothetical protein